MVTGQEYIGNGWLAVVRGFCLFWGGWGSFSPVHAGQRRGDTFGLRQLAAFVALKPIRTVRTMARISIMKPMTLESHGYGS